MLFRRNYNVRVSNTNSHINRMQSITTNRNIVYYCIQPHLWRSKNKWWRTSIMPRCLIKDDRGISCSLIAHDKTHETSNSTRQSYNFEMRCRGLKLLVSLLAFYKMIHHSISLDGSTICLDQSLLSPFITLLECKNIAEWAERFL